MEQKTIPFGNFHCLADVDGSAGCNLDGYIEALSSDYYTDSANTASFCIKRTQCDSGQLDECLTNELSLLEQAVRIREGGLQNYSVYQTPPSQNEDVVYVAYEKTGKEQYHHVIDELSTIERLRFTAEILRVLSVFASNEQAASTLAPEKVLLPKHRADDESAIWVFDYLPSPSQLKRGEVLTNKDCADRFLVYALTGQWRSNDCDFSQIVTTCSLSEGTKEQLLAIHGKIAACEDEASELQAAAQLIDNVVAGEQVARQNSSNASKKKWPKVMALIALAALIVVGIVVGIALTHKEPVDPIVGSWTLERYGNQFTDEGMNTASAEQKDTMEFKADGSLVWSPFVKDTTMRWELLQVVPVEGNTRYTYRLRSEGAGIDLGTFIQIPDAGYPIIGLFLPGDDLPFGYACYIYFKDEPTK